MEVYLQTDKEHGSNHHRRSCGGSRQAGKGENRALGSAQRRAEAKKRTETEATPTWSRVAPTSRNLAAPDVDAPRYQVGLARCDV